MKQFIVKMLKICIMYCQVHTDQQQQQQQPFYGPLSGTTWAHRYQKKHSPTQVHTRHFWKLIQTL